MICSCCHQEIDDILIWTLNQWKDSSLCSDCVDIIKAKQTHRFKKRNILKEIEKDAMLTIGNKK